ncbi:hypothetical protein AVEN_1576-1 [Araneus ventricosus]|uniref:Uncharacterized protein n=1 Tax=Araneus ventricosus TaxID=182803 RepID=A0A4Y2DTB6_ARAVE|nr:hypothetical protein AVEN_1576-1 [Araneus ventricosus]
MYNMFKKQWQSTCDGSGLKGSGDVPRAHSWVLDGTSLLSGRDTFPASMSALGCSLIGREQLEVETNNIYVQEDVINRRP